MTLHKITLENSLREEAIVREIGWYPLNPFIKLKDYGKKILRKINVFYQERAYRKGLRNSRLSREVKVSQKNAHKSPFSSEESTPQESTFEEEAEEEELPFLTIKAPLLTPFLKKGQVFMKSLRISKPPIYLLRHLQKNTSFCKRFKAMTLILPLVFVFLLNLLPLQAQCVGRFLNPVTDICWKCLFPIKIAGYTVVKGGPDPESVKKFICACGTPIPRIGIPISFWEPVRLVDVTRTPWCLVNMGGIQALSTGARGRGDIEEDQETVTKKSFYQVHWYVYPVIYWLELLMDFLCLEKMSIDLAYVTELDPLWSDDEKNTILNPEALLFGNGVAQAACAADCIAASAHLPLDALFWCGGCQGSLYPFTGTLDHHTGGVQASLLMVQRMIARLHREGLLWGYMGEAGLCGKYWMPFIRKSQYRTQMTYPVPHTQACQTLGHTEISWGAGREFPYKGSDFGYLIFRRRDCCLL